MEIVKTLLWSDSRALIRWFSERTVSRFIVAILFVALFSVIAVVLYQASGIFFRLLWGYGLYGELTAGYLIHATIIILLWLGLTSAIASFSGLLLRPGPTLPYLFTLPIKPSYVAAWLFIKSIGVNFFLLLFLFMPVALSYGQYFDIVNITYLLRVIIVLLSVVIITGSIGSAVGQLFLGLVRGREYAGSILGVGIFFIIMVMLLKFIFPPSLSELYNAPSASFVPIFGSLPLNNPALPTNWMVETITHGSLISIVLMILFSVGTGLVSYAFGSVRFLPTFRYIYSKSNRSAFTEYSTRFLRSRRPILLKDWLSIVRLPSEKGYGLFLGSVAVFFFLFLGYGVGKNIPESMWRSQLLLFNYIWILFFATALFLRFVFPLMAREGKSAWYLFTMPLLRKVILKQKVTLALAMSIPVAGASVLLWLWPAFGGSYRLGLMSLSAFSIVLLSVLHALIGAIFPNFVQGEDTEKVSTSGMGLLALILSGTVVATGVWGIQFFLHGTNLFIVAFSFLSLGALFLDILWILANYSMKRYEW